jgi:hypothetical protein
LIVYADIPEKAGIAVYRITGVLEKKQQYLAYNKVLDSLNKRIPTVFNFQFYHALRAVNIFNMKNIDCLFPRSKLAYDSDIMFFESIPIQVANAYFIGTENINSNQITDINHPPLRIGYKRGNTYGGNIEKLKHH